MSNLGTRCVGEAVAVVVGRVADLRLRADLVGTLDGAACALGQARLAGADVGTARDPCDLQRLQIVVGVAGPRSGWAQRCGVAIDVTADSDLAAELAGRLADLGVAAAANTGCGGVRVTVTAEAHGLCLELIDGGLRLDDSALESMRGWVGRRITPYCGAGGAFISVAEGMEGFVYNFALKIQGFSVASGMAEARDNPDGLGDSVAFRAFKAKLAIGWAALDEELLVGFGLRGGKLDAADPDGGRSLSLRSSAGNRPDVRPRGLALTPRAGHGGRQIVGADSHWERDQRLLDVAGGARAARTEVAGRRLSTGGQ